MLKLSTPGKIDFASGSKLLQPSEATTTSTQKGEGRLKRKRLIRSLWERKKQDAQGEGGKNYVVLNKQVTFTGPADLMPQSTTDPGSLLHKMVHKKFGSLLFKNLPFLEERSGFSRFELIQMFSHFVVLSKITTFVKTRSDDIF